MSGIRRPPHPDLREGDLLRREVRAGGVAGVEPDRLRVLGVAAPPGRVLVCAVREPLSDDLCHLGEHHLDPEAAVGLQVPFEALVLLASDHGHIMPRNTRSVLLRRAVTPRLGADRD
jgi:hypothetical protein